MKKITLFIAAFLICIPHLAVAETISLSTYYPAPFGTYDRIRLVPRPIIPGPLCRVGTLYTRDTDFTLQYCADVGGGPNAGNWGPMEGLWRNDVADNVWLIDSDTVDFRVGIGTVSPNTQLELFGDIQHGIRLDTNSKSTIKLFNNALGLGQTTSLGIEFTPVSGFGNTLSSITGGWETSTSRGTLAFRTSSDGGTTIPERMVILGNGNVGIGTSSPNFQLEVRSTTPGQQAAYIRSDATSGIWYSC